MLYYALAVAELNRRAEAVKALYADEDPPA
jgi:hypothetical protein